MRITYKELKAELKVNQIVYDKLSLKSAIIVKLEPLTIKLDEERETLVERDSADLEYYIWTKEELDEITRLVQKFSKLF